LTGGPPPPELALRSPRPDRAFTQGNRVRAGRRRHDVRLSTDSKKSPSWRLPEQVPVTLPLDGGGDVPSAGRLDGLQLCAHVHRARHRHELAHEGRPTAAPNPCAHVSGRRGWLDRANRPHHALPTQLPFPQRREPSRCDSAASPAASRRPRLSGLLEDPRQDRRQARLGPGARRNALFWAAHPA
jgi:hypothetical protein